MSPTGREFLDAFHHAFGEGGRVVHAGDALGEGDLHLHAEGLAHAGADGLDALFHPGAGVLGDGAQGAHQLGGLGQHVGGGAALELADGQGALLEGRDLPGQKVLKGLIDVHPGVDGVHAVLGHAALREKKVPAV